MEVHNYDIMSLWLIEYGSVALFCLLALGVVALPIPDETLMVLAGVLMKKGELQFPPTLLAAYAGTMAGISLSYIIGRTVGYYFFHRYGSYIGITEAKLNKAHRWFEAFGKWTLIFGYFIPGVRHFTGVSAGVAALEYPVFALFAYTGAILWSTVFLSIGYFLSEYWVSIFHTIERNVDVLGFLAVVLIVVYFLNKFKKK